mgnify:CR=1 FL=1
MSKYVNGYAEKIGYWQYKLNKAIESGNVGGVEYATQRLKYFMNRQHEVYGKNVIAGVDFSESLNLLKSL